MSHKPPLLVIHVGDEKGFLVIDTLLGNTSAGGVRIAPDVSVEELSVLAREMSLKYALFGIRRGGAKCGIKMSYETCGQAKREILEEFGRSVAPIVRSGVYFPGMDMNCGPDDLKAIYRGAGILLGKITDTSYFAAMSVASAVEACREEIVSSPTRVLTVAVEGFGAVAAHVAAMLPAHVYRIVAVSTLNGATFHRDGFGVDVLLRGRDSVGNEFVTRIAEGEPISKESVLTADVDVLMPSARTWAINDSNSTQVKARFVVPIANGPYTSRAVAVLHERGVTCLPGFLTNAGAVYASALFDSGFSVSRLAELMAAHYKPAVKALLEKSRETGCSPVDVATALAETKFSVAAARRLSAYRRMLGTDTGRRLLPKTLHRRAARQDLLKNLSQLSSDIRRFRWERNVP